MGKQCTIKGKGIFVGEGRQFNCFSHPPERSRAQSAMVVVLLALGGVLLSGQDTLDTARPVPSNPATPTRAPGATPSAAPQPPQGSTRISAPTGSPAPKPTPPRSSPTSRAPSAPVLPDAPSADPAPKPSPKRVCSLRQQYRVNKKGQIWDSRGNRIGDVASGTLFFRQESASYPSPVHDRYYGTVDEVISGSATGYVLRKKLDYVGGVEICD
ncbi:hypothetical protein [Streptomyces qinzhouensis]|uniref:Uncharacterized protein n=1 Tax=Streptomyces qinzhouensis TaxID=2599401 RepID=A0A5B8JR17_9ACTN|nr:hypothetical protein [Streptomyces qinzhouensis]QDY80390.1 hypothetical protein FQU76_32105 [Streptomyces qinzhouensis]